MEQHLSEDGTVTFLPNRLNRQPIIVRGLTADEMWLTAGVTGVGGLLLGIGVAVMTGQIGMAPTTVLVCMALGIFGGGSLIRRKKRGRPETWLYRQAQWYIVCNYPMLSSWIGGRQLINRTGWWTTRRNVLPVSRKKIKDKTS